VGEGEKCGDAIALRFVPWKIVAEIADRPKWSGLLADIRTWFEKQYHVSR
jgi:hypothetical protein